MGFVELLKKRAKESVKTIVLPETEDMRTLEATDKILKEGVAKIILIGNEEEIRECSGIRIFGMRIKSIAFTTDVAIIKNINADAIIAVYPFTPQPAISQAVIGISDVPVFVGVGGGITGGDRSVRLAIEAENQGAFGVVVNAPISNEVISRIKEVVDIPVIATIVSDQMDIRSRIEAGADFLNVSGAAATPQIVRRIRAQFPNIPILATGGPNDETILETIHAGANAITYSPPSNGELFAAIMQKYRGKL